MNDVSVRVRVGRESRAMTDLVEHILFYYYDYIHETKKKNVFFSSSSFDS